VEKNRQRFVLSKFDNEKSKIVCMRCRIEVRWPKNNDGKSADLRHPCLANNGKAVGTGKLRVKSNLFYVYNWRTDKLNCKSCIQIVERNTDTENYYLTPAQRHKRAMHNFNLKLQKTTCRHWGDEQRISSTGPTTLERHGCGERKYVPDRLFLKMPWCPRIDCTECLILEDR
jgi:hypothetical protein